MALGDFDGDALDEIAFCGDGQGFGTNIRAVIADGKDEVITVEYMEGGAGGHDVFVQGYNEAGNWVELKSFYSACVYSGNYFSTTICAANLDNDTPVVRYTGEHELLFTDRTIIAVLACPPYHGGSGQNIEACALKRLTRRAHSSIQRCWLRRISCASRESVRCGLARIRRGGQPHRRIDRVHPVGQGDLPLELLGEDEVDYSLEPHPASTLQKIMDQRANLSSIAAAENAWRTWALSNTAAPKRYALSRSVN